MTMTKTNTKTMTMTMTMIKTFGEYPQIQTLRYKIWDLGLASKSHYKGKIWAFGTKLGLFWGLLVAIFMTTAKLTQEGKGFKGFKAHSRKIRTF